MIQWPTTHDNDSMQAYTRTGLQTEDREKFASSSSHTHWVSQGITKIVNDPGLVKIICWIFILKPWLQPVLSVRLLYCIWLLHSVTHSSDYCTLFCLLRTLLTIAHSSGYCAHFPFWKLLCLSVKGPSYACARATHFLQSSRYCNTATH